VSGQAGIRSEAGASARDANDIANAMLQAKGILSALLVIFLQWTRRPHLRSIRLAYILSGDQGRPLNPGHRSQLWVFIA
jgi:hypothetical protein